MRVIRIVDAIGNALILQLCFVLCSIPLVTIVPSAVALQRSLDGYRAGERTGFLPYLAQLRRAWSQYWRLGLLAAAVGVGAAMGLLFWLQVESTIGHLAVGLLMFWSGLGAALYLSLLEASSAFPDLDGRTVLSRAVAVVRSHPLRSLLGLMLFWSWLVVLMMVPTLALVGSGLIPAIIARYALGGSLFTLKPLSSVA